MKRRATESLKERIFRYFRSRPGQWIAGAEIEDLTEKNTNYVASNASRKCRELCAEGKLEREIRPSETGNRRKIAYYRYTREHEARTASRATQEFFDTHECRCRACTEGTQKH